MWFDSLRSVPTCLLWIAILFAQGCGGKESADKTSLAEELAKAKNTSNPALRARRLVAVASKQRDAGDASGAQSSIKMARRSCNDIESIDDRLKALNGVAEALAKTGYTTEAEEILKEAKEAYPDLADGLSRTQIATKMAEIYGRYLGKKRTAAGFLLEVESTADSIPDAALRIQAMAGIAVAYHHLDADDQFEQQMQKTLASARAIEDTRAKTEALLTVAIRMTELNESRQARQLIEEADQLIQSIGEPHSRAYALISLARAWQEAGDQGAAQESLARADDVADQTDASLRGPLKEQIAATKKRQRSDQ